MASKVATLCQNAWAKSRRIHAAVPCPATSSFASAFTDDRKRKLSSWAGYIQCNMSRVFNGGWLIAFTANQYNW
jgi:hypothetical protein